MITLEQRNNLRKLAEYLLDEDTQAKSSVGFDMTNYCFTDTADLTNTIGSLKPRQWECGTIACAAGHGPAAGIEVIETDTDWDYYVNRVFGEDNETLLMVEVANSDLLFWGKTALTAWTWCFSSGWYSIDNTKAGAAYRILHYLAVIEEDADNHEYTTYSAVIQRAKARRAKRLGAAS